MASRFFSRRRLLQACPTLGAAYLAGTLTHSWWSGNSWAEADPKADPKADLKAETSPQKKAESLGIKFEKATPGYLNKCVRSGNWLITSGHTSKIKGKLGADLDTKQGAEAAKECAIEILKSVWNEHGTLDGLRVLKVLGCVNCTPTFVDQPLVVNGCSDLLHEIFGKTTDGYHARSALGFASLPSGVAVEIEAIFEIKAKR